MAIKWLKKGWVALAYTLLTLAMTWPVVLRIGSHYVGTGGDLLIFPWNDWWCLKCLREGRSPFFTTSLFYPHGVSLIYHNFAWLNTAMWLPLEPLIGPIAAYNVIFLFNLALGGIGMYYLARDLEGAEDVLSTDPELYSTDLVSYFVPDRSHLLFRPWLEGLWSRMRRGAYLGYGALALAGIGLCKGRRERALWLVVGLALLVLSLGPRLQVAGRQFDVTLPYAWVRDWPPVQVLRHPNRFSVYLSLPQAALAAQGTAWLMRGIPWVSTPVFARNDGQCRRPWMWAAGLSLLVLFEYLPWPYPTLQPAVPEFYRRLAQEPGEFAVLDLPMGARTVAKPYMYYATVHGKPLVEGHVSRLPLSAYGFIDSVPLLRGLRRSGEMDPALGDISRQLSMLAEADVRYLILHPGLVPPEQLARWRSWLATAPLFEDQDTIVYRTRPQHGRDFHFIGEVGDGIGLISATLSSSVLAQDGMLEVTLVWGTWDAPGQAWLARLALVSPAGSEAQRVDFAPCPDWPVQAWGSDAVARGTAALRIDPFIEGGTYAVTVGLVDPATSARVGQPVSVGQVEVQAVERVFEQPQMQVAAGASFGNALQLLGYDLQQEGQVLRLTLHWQAQRRMAVASKFFVHVLDAATGELVAQADVMPRDWGYPTTWWEQGEVVSDEIALSVADVPAGGYRVVAGVYDPETGARLPVADPARGGAAADHWLLFERLDLP